MKLISLPKTLIACSIIYTSTAFSQSPITGAGTANNIPRFTSASVIGVSQITDNGTTVSLGTASVAIAGVMTAGDLVSIQKSQNLNTQVGLRNLTSGTAAAATYFATSLGSTISMSTYNLNFTDNGIFQKRAGVINATGTGGINVGTTAAAQLSLWTNNLKRLTVSSTGSVGIGTATPDKWFTVVSPTANNTQIAKFADDARYIGLGRDEVAAFTLAGAVADMYMGNNGTNTYIRGNVGIGTNTPKEHLQIGDRIVFHDGGAKYLGYNMFYNGANNERLVADYSSALSFYGGEFNFQTATTGAAGTLVNTTSKFIIKNTGEVGIGTSTPTKTLTVMGDMSITSAATYAFDIIDAATPSVVNFRVQKDGKVYAREVNVQLTPFPDYVFDKDYKLATLSEVEAYINANKHLKGFEAAKEYESKGMNVGEVVKLQQEKIEELTLYIIEQQKQLEELKKDMKSLKK